ncbi:hypothetical protein NECAME_02140 [Necator americanus]|uniref:Uncharacterized protein n=1 Tax=Necator americanus TaxID=51031 RepID=W2THC7_NECAM|nr:hypothetical protein NECAME_02140 [Necator americanus]ETN81460.1 hypothetical protein NECAME_02140 [Necator americanus]
MKKNNDASDGSLTSRTNAVAQQIDRRRNTRAAAHFIVAVARCSHSHQHLFAVVSHQPGTRSRLTERKQDAPLNDYLSSEELDKLSSCLSEFGTPAFVLIALHSEYFEELFVPEKLAYCATIPATAFVFLVRIPIKTTWCL